MVIKQLFTAHTKPLCVFGILDTTLGNKVKTEMEEWLLQKFDVYEVYHDGKLFEYEAINFAKNLSCDEDECVLYIHTKGGGNKNPPQAKSFINDEVDVPIGATIDDWQGTVRNFWKNQYMNYLDIYLKLCNENNGSIITQFTGKKGSTWNNSFFITPDAAKKMVVSKNNNRYYYEHLFNGTKINVIGVIYNDINYDDRKSMYKMQSYIWKSYIKNDEKYNSYCMYTVLNDNFLAGGKVMLYSFLKNNQWFNGDINILYSDVYSKLSKTSMDSLSKMYNKINFIKINDIEYNKNVNLNTIPKHFISPLIKLEVFGDTRYDKILYLDADTIVISDISELFEYESDDILVFGHENDNILTPRKYHNDIAINNGVFLVNKTLLNADNLTEIYKIYKEYKRGCKFYTACPDQDVMCEFLRRKYPNNITVFKTIYNTLKRVFAFNKRTIANEKIIHYVEKDKPWNSNSSKYSYINSIWTKYKDSMESNLNSNIIVTMTTWTKRQDNIIETLKSIFKQTKAPNKIVINLSLEEFPNKLDSLNEKVKQFIEENTIIEVNWIEGKNTKQWKKIIPTILKYPDDIIICIDDDRIYGSTFIETLWKAYLTHTNNAITVNGSYKVHGRYLQHCGHGTLVKASFYDNFNGIDLDEMINNYESSDTFFNFMLYRNGHPLIYCGYDNSVKYNEIEPLTSNYDTRNETKHCELWDYLVSKYKISDISNKEYVSHGELSKKKIFLQSTNGTSNNTQNTQNKREIINNVAYNINKEQHHRVIENRVISKNRMVKSCVRHINKNTITRSR